MSKEFTFTLSFKGTVWSDNDVDALEQIRELAVEYLSGLADQDDELQEIIEVKEIA